MKIFKYTLLPIDGQVVEMPVTRDLQILSAKEQDGQIVVYAMVNQDAPKTLRVSFRVFGTGFELTPDIHLYTFLDTVKLQGGALMFHVFYKIGVD